MKEQEHVIRINPDGSIISLYNDDSLIRQIPGSKEVTRASTVEYDPRIDKWVLYLNKEDGSRESLLAPGIGFVRREDAISFEVDFLDQLLSMGFDPGKVFDAAQKGKGVADVTTPLDERK